MRFWVRVPVLSEAMREVEPSVSTDWVFLTSTLTAGKGGQGGKPKHTTCLEQVACSVANQHLQQYQDASSSSPSCPPACILRAVSARDTVKVTSRPSGTVATTTPMASTMACTQVCPPRPMPMPMNTSPMMMAICKVEWSQFGSTL